ncbi:hypothetical protein HNQ07_003099 [Deinococcus metalli]|uniref:NUDIX hydrolase n=1 Tax=Deinococcus metalli TaxID=1141878 RepID=A0A7W8NR71_9DEIO|nr:hypothetical protein [Deinococcus metalli]MBB5377600.1 hypothetical protein [Deinococcus metalli]GHF51983.1 hypothetical protein GCM10017781_30270 [Deinococcus metalli]
MTSTSDTHSTPVAFQVGVFALVQHQGSYLIVRHHQPLLPGGTQSLPGLILDVPAGNNIIELHLRRALLSQVGLAVSDLRLVGSHAGRGVQSGRGDARLNLIFGTQYCSGILNPQPDVLSGAEWLPSHEFGEYSGAPEWLQGAIREFETVTVPPTARTPGMPLPSFFRRRQG